MNAVHLRQLCIAASVVIASSSWAGDGYGIRDIGHLNCIEANKRLNEGMNAGVAEAFYTTAQMVARRVCFKREFDAYAKLLTSASDRGHKPAMRDLGYAHGLGEGVEQDYAKAGEWLRKSGEQGGAELDDYTLGYAWTTAWQIRRRAGLSVPIWLKHRHVVRIDLTIDPRRPPARAELRLVGPTPAGAEVEAEKLLANARAAVADSITTAAKKVPSPVIERLVDKPFTVQWDVHFTSSTDKDVDTSNLDAVIPR